MKMIDKRFSWMACGLVGLLIVAAVGSVAAHPTPAPVPVRWELQFHQGDLRLYQDTQTGNAYWYYTYKVVNRTGSKQLWAPSFTLFTDTGEIMYSGQRVPRRVTEDLLELLGNEFLEDQYEIIGEIFQGKEHAREGLVIWPAFELSANELSLFIGGISGETARVSNPATGDEVILQKTLQLDFLIPGNALAIGSRSIQLVDQQWIFRDSRVN